MDYFLIDITNLRFGQFFYENYHKKIHVFLQKDKSTFKDLILASEQTEFYHFVSQSLNLPNQEKLGEQKRWLSCLFIYLDFLYALKNIDSS